MKRIELMQRYLNEKHRTTLVHEQYLNTQREYAPGTSLYMREIHFLVALGPDNPASISSLAQRLEVTPGAVSQLAARLENKGYITRTPDPKNRRRTLVSLTEKGRRLYLEHLDYDQASLSRLSAFFEDFSDTEIQRMIDAEIIFQQALRSRFPE